MSSIKSVNMPVCCTNCPPIALAASASGQIMLRSPANLYDVKGRQQDEPRKR